MVGTSWVGGVVRWTSFDMRDFDAHEQVVFGCDAASGLRAIIAIHSTTLGPAAGGCRMWPYAASSDAVVDAVRLSRGMSYKNAMAELPFGGGKAVIIGDPREKTRQRMEAFGRLVDSLGGRYITAEDVGTTTTDMGQVAGVTPFVSGLARESERVAEAGMAVGGDPGPKTALGVFLGLKAAVRFRLGRASVEGLKVAVQGLGGVGYPLCRLLAAEGASLRVADSAARRGAAPLPGSWARRKCPLNRSSRRTWTSLPRARWVPCSTRAPSRPCALASLPALRTTSLRAKRMERDCMRAGILYAPDYVINAGGIISVAHEYQGGATAAQVKAEIERIPVRLTEIFERARREGRATSAIADQMARERLVSGTRRMVA